ncbi:MAG: hypothetical protein ACKODP_01695 [Actinomycetota bacterium]
METLSAVARVARPPRAVRAHEVDERPLPAEVIALELAVQEREDPAEFPPPPDWAVVVRLMGEPCAESREGVRAVFAKKRSLELLCWMVLNRDRSTRSAARTAMWDLDVADSTFSTVVSEMRRSLGRVTPALSAADASPLTYGDTLPLSDQVVTDVELLEQAVAAARGDSSAIDQVVSALSLVRDVPFAGTAYQWADLDGSTTRIIISVMRAVDFVLEEGRYMSRPDLVLAGTRAGLRVMPGDERLLALQESLAATLWT